MSKIVLAFCAAAILSACVSKVNNPVTSDLREQFTVEKINVALSQEQLPDRYDESVNEYVASEDFARFRDEFIAFADERGGLTEQNSSELFLQHILEKGVQSLPATGFAGDRAATLNVDIQSTAFPNAATMMLVGEVIGISYMFDLTDDITGAKIIESKTRLSPFVDRSAGAGGGLLGMAMRGSGTERHIKDLENLAIAAATQINNILGASQIEEPVAKALAINQPPLLVEPVGDPQAGEELQADAPESAES
jgi:hypothetical protein